MKYLILATILFFAATALAQMPTGTATPQSPSTTISRPSVMIRHENPTLWTTCDYYFANWGNNRNPGTREKPFGWDFHKVRRNFGGKLVCNINDNFGEVNGRD